MIIIYHNPRCGKSRQCLAFLETSNHSFEVIKYLENPIKYEELAKLIQKLKLNPIDLIRTKETIWIKKFKGKKLSNTEIIQSMIDFPILMERPLVVYGEKAVIVRPWERINTIL